MNKIVRPTLWLAIVVLITFNNAQAQSDPQTSPPSKPALTVESVMPIKRDWEKIIKTNGGLFAWQESIVAAELGGLAITDLPVDVGSVVKQGQLLIRLNQQPIKAALALQEANINKAKATLAEAQSNADRARQVRGSGALSEQMIHQYLSAEESAKANLAAAQASLQADQVRLRQTEIVAIDRGIISSRSATRGSVVQPGAELLRLVRQERIEWRAELTALQLLQTQVGQKARLTLANDLPIEGTVRMLSPTLDPNTRKAVAYIDLPPESPARAGMFAQGEIIVGLEPALTLPLSATLLRDGHTYIFIIDKNDQVDMRKVQTGRQQGSEIEILGELSETDQVVLSGGSFLNQSDRVRVAAPKPTEGTTPK
ncbi:MAG: efflux RND transporter periplasmic adaptor subunit [Magnetococcus sp. DMHC-6]